MRSDSTVMRDLVEYTRGGISGEHPSPFAATIVQTETNEELISYRNGVVPEVDPTAHAEVGVIRLAAKKLGTTYLSGYSMFTTLHPCPMCMGAALWSGLDRMVYGTTFQDPEKGQKHLFGAIDDARIIERECLFDCIVDGPLEEPLVRKLVDDPIISAYTNHCYMNNVRI